MPLYIAVETGVKLMVPYARDYLCAPPHLSTQIVAICEETQVITFKRVSKNDLELMAKEGSEQEGKMLG